jgi:two-component system, sensor histidine kinase
MVLQLDDLRVSQVLNNLVSNSIKFTGVGSITVSCTIEEHTLQFEVRDTGIGIPSNKLNIVFDRFRQADESHTRKFGGSGLGLSICKKLVAIMRGSIGVDSVEDEGAKFWFTLPVVPAVYEE